MFHFGFIRSYLIIEDDHLVYLYILFDLWDCLWYVKFALITIPYTLGASVDLPICYWRNYAMIIMELIITYAMRMVRHYYGS